MTFIDLTKTEGDPSARSYVAQLPEGIKVHARIHDSLVLRAAISSSSHSAAVATIMPLISKTNVPPERPQEMADEP
jgi:hypothetical protein